MWIRYAENQLLIGRLNLLSSRDTLTGIANRRALDNHFKLLSDQLSPCALLLLDVDFFKLYNDNYGHQAGDEFLKGVADVLQTAVRHPQDLAGRYGGEGVCAGIIRGGQRGGGHRCRTHSSGAFSGCNASSRFGRERLRHGQHGHCGSIRRMDRN